MEKTLEEKYAEVNAIIDQTAKALDALGVPHFIAAIDRDARDPDGGKVFVASEVKGPDMQQIFKHAFPANKDLINLGLWVGNEIMQRNKNAAISFGAKKRTKKPKTDGSTK
jgi:hypothetical protein